MGMPACSAGRCTVGSTALCAVGGRVILFLNRRGNAGFIQCRRCGSSLKCRRCSTTLAAHAVPRKEDGGVRLVCHYCNLQTRYRTDCPVCGSSALVPFAPGTQAVVEEVNRRFPRAGVLRWDRDSARTAREHTALLERFIAGPEHVLVGTQMVAKGLDIHSVTLVGVVSADTGLSIPDFRGRAGVPGSHPGGWPGGARPCRPRDHPDLPAGALRGPGGVRPGLLRVLCDRDPVAVGLRQPPVLATRPARIRRCRPAEGREGGGAVCQGPPPRATRAAKRPRR